MRLTAALFKHKKMFLGPIPKFKGSALSGKHKFVPPATRGTRYLMWLDWRNEEEVLKHISKPFITADEELDYLESIGLRHQNVDPEYTSRIETPMRQRYATEVIEYFDRNRQYEILE